MRFVADAEIDLRKTDLFNSLHYSSTLADSIKCSQNEPFTIGVFGEWGSGKSSIVKTAQGILEDDKEKKYHFFTYDAWKYSKDSFRRTFLINLANSLKLQGNEMFRSFYESRTETVPVKRVVNYGLLSLLTVILVGVLLLSFFGTDSTNWSWTLQTILMTVAIAITFVTNISKEYVGTRQNPMLFSPEQFEACFDEMLSKVITRRSATELLLCWFKGETYEKNIDRLVIVLDNLDRCERQIAYELLSDFKNFLGKDQVVFVIPVDDTALRRHVASINNSTHQEADEFLRKIFNNTIKIKPYKTHDLYEFTESLSAAYDLNVKPNTIDVIAKEYATNPRRIIQFLNSLVSEKDYLSRRMGSDFVTKYETLIALILLIREEWPELYRQLSDAPYKLKNLQQALLLAKEGVGQEIFLRKTHPHTANIEDTALKVIFTNQEQYPHISDALINALAARHTETIKEFIGLTDNGNKYLADYVIGELKHGVGREVISSLAGAFNELVFLNGISPLSESTNKRILGELNSKTIKDQCISNFDNAEHFALYLNNLEEQGLRDLPDVLLDYLDKLVGADDSSEQKEPGLLAKKWVELTKALAIICTSTRILDRLEKPFFIGFRDEDFSILGEKIPDSNLKAIVRDRFVKLVIEQDDFHGEGRYGDWMALIKAGAASPSDIEFWLQRFLSHHGNFGNHSKEDFLRKLALVTDAISTCKCNIDAESFQGLLDVIFNARSLSVLGQPPKTISLASEISGNHDEIQSVIDLIGWVYFSTLEAGGSAQRLIEIASQSGESEDLVLRKLVWLHDQFDFSLVPFYEFLLTRSRIDTTLLKIYKWLLIRKVDGNYVLPDAGARTIIEKCVEVLIEGNENLIISSHFETWVQDARTKEILTQTLSGKDRDLITKLPNTVQATTYSYISQGDNIFEFEDDIEIMAAMNKQNSPAFNKQIEKVILRKLTKDESFAKGLDLLEQIVSFDGMNTPSIKSLLDGKTEVPEFVDRVSVLAKKLSELKK